jgi:iron complex outermembrane recepter protein
LRDRIRTKNKLRWRDVKQLILTNLRSALCASLVLGTSVAAAAGQGGSPGNPAAGTQSAPEEADQGLTEIVVTAQKFAETVNTTPVAVTALGMAALQDAGVNAVKDLTSAVPNLQIHTMGAEDFVGITIRGISNLTYVASGNPAVSTYVDGIYVDQPVGFSNDMYDLERIEALRGPQGTLYGRNATGGNLNIITADPKPDFGAAADVSYGNYNDVAAHAMVNVPVSDTLAVRAAFMSHRNDGYFDTEGTTARNYGAADDFGVRLTSLWKPVAGFTWRLSFDGFQDNGTPGMSIQTGENGRPVNGLSPYKQPTSSDPEPDNNVRSAAVRSRMDFKVTDDLSLTYTAGYQGIRWSYVWATAGQIGAPVTPPIAKLDQTNDAHSQSHELDLNYTTDHVKNVLGATYFNESIGGDVHEDVPLAGFVSRSLNDVVYEKRSWGVFDQATFSVTDALRLTGGARYSHDFQSSLAEQDLECIVNPAPLLGGVSALNPGSPGCFVVPFPYASGSWSHVNWKAGVEYDVNSATLAYASVTTGYKQGGVQTGLPAPLPSTFKPETVTSYEAGTKLRLLDNALNVRLAAFFADYTDLQNSTFEIVSGTPLTVVENAGTSHIYGVEVESEWKATPVDYFSAFFTYLHARYTVFNNGVDPQNPAIDIPSLAGNQLPNAPDESVRLEYHHDFPLPNGAALSPLIASYWQSTSYSDAVNTPIYKIGGYSKTDLQLTYSDPSAHWKVQGYVQNVENHAVRNADFEIFGGVYSDFNPPRLYGIRASYKY